LARISALVISSQRDINRLAASAALCGETSGMPLMAAVGRSRAPAHRISDPSRASLTNTESSADMPVELTTAPD
jgi:hypothetical protein